MNGPRKADIGVMPFLEGAKEMSRRLGVEQANH
jgi:hypothetical protein